MTLIMALWPSHRSSSTNTHQLTHGQTATNASTNTNKTRFGFVIYASFDACFKRKQFVWWVFYPNIVIIYFRFYVQNALICARTCVCVLFARNVSISEQTAMQMHGVTMSPSWFRIPFPFHAHFYFRQHTVAIVFFSLIYFQVK